MFPMNLNLIDISYVSAPAPVYEHTIDEVWVPHWAIMAAKINAGRVFNAAASAVYCIEEDAVNGPETNEMEYARMEIEDYADGYFGTF